MDETPGVVISWLFPESVSGWFAKSLADLILHDTLEGGGYLRPRERSGFIALSSGPRVAEARNQIIDQFASNWPEAEWLLMLDSDMTFPCNLLDILMANADPVEAPIVGGLCFAGARANAPYPTIYRAVQKDGYASVERVYDYPRNAMVKVGATGGACLLMHRQALSTMQAKFGASAYPWFAEGAIGPEGELWGEDILFCLRANALGIPVWVNTAAKLGHMKTHCIDEAYYDNLRSEPKAHVPNRAERRRAAREKAKVS